MKILAFDTSHGNCSVAIHDDTKLVAEKTDETKNAQAERLLQHIEYCLTSAKITFSDINYIATTSGPGSFTGVRIGIATAKGLHLATKIPLIGITAFESIAENTDLKAPTLVVIDAKRNQVYAQLLSPSLTPLSKPALLEYSEINTFDFPENYTLTGNGAHLIENNLPKGFTLQNPKNTVSAHSVAKAAHKKLKNKQKNELDPLYIRKPDAKPPQQ